MHAVAALLSSTMLAVSTAHIIHYIAIFVLPAAARSLGRIVRRKPRLMWECVSQSRATHLLTNPIQAGCSGSGRCLLSVLTAWAHI